MILTPGWAIHTAQAILPRLDLRCLRPMTFGLTRESRELLERIVRSRDSAPGRAEETQLPVYLPLAGNASDGALSELVQKWVEPEAKILRNLAGRALEGTEASWDCVLLSGTIHYKDQMQLLCRARKLLKEQGRLILVGEYLRDVETILKSSLPTEFCLKQLSKRLGFRLVDTVDWTKNARQSVADAQALIAKFSAGTSTESAAWLRKLRDRLRGTGAENSRGPVHKLARELDLLADEFALGHRRFGCFVLELDDTAGGPWSELDLGDIHSFEPEEVAEIFQESFQTEFDPALWRWKYGAEKGTCIVARTAPGGPVIAHYGGVAREIDYFGVDQLAFQGCDVMVKPAVRKQYGRNSLYFHMTATLFEREIGYTVNHVLGFGFPNKPVMKTAVRLGLYGKVDDYVQVAFPAPGDPGPAIQARSMDLENASCKKTANDLWQAMRQDFLQGVIGKRHDGYLDYRYFRHPNVAAYFPLLLTQDDAAFAIAVLKRHEEQWLLMDVVAPLARMNETVRALQAWINSRNQPGELKMWLTNAWVERLSWQDRIEKNLGIEIPFNAWNPGPDSTLPYGAWWLTAGDMDFM